MSDCVPNRDIRTASHSKGNNSKLMAFHPSGSCRLGKEKYSHLQALLFKLCLIAGQFVASLNPNQVSRQIFATNKLVLCSYRRTASRKYPKFSGFRTEPNFVPKGSGAFQNGTVCLTCEKRFRPRCVFSFRDRTEFPPMVEKMFRKLSGIRK